MFSHGALSSPLPTHFPEVHTSSRYYGTPLMTTVRRGYTLQFTQRPTRFRGVLTTTVRSEDAQVLLAEVMNLLKRSHRNRSSSPERVRLLQPLLPRPQKRWRPATYFRSQTPELRPDEKVAQDDHFETLVFLWLSG